MPKKYPTDQRDRALRMALERLPEYASPWAAAQALGPKLGVGPETLRKWIVQAQIDGCLRTLSGAEQFAAIRSYTATATATASKDQINIYHALTQLAAGEPWLPPAQST